MVFQAPRAELDYLYNIAPIGLCLMDTDLRFVHINAMLVQINGKPIEEHIGKTLYDAIPQIVERVVPTRRCPSRPQASADRSTASVQRACPHP